MSGPEYAFHGAELFMEIHFSEASTGVDFRVFSHREAKRFDYMQSANICLASAESNGADESGGKNRFLCSNN